MPWYNALNPFRKRGMVGTLETKDDPTYGVAMQFFNPGQPVFSDRNYRAFVAQGYRRCGTAYNCINQIAGGASGIKWKLYTDASMSREITSHPLLDLWRAPNPRHGTGAFVEQSFGFWHLSGNMYTWANRPSDTEPPVELWALRPDLVKIVTGEHDIAGYVYGYGTSRARDFLPQEVMHLKFPAYDDEFYGLSPLEVAMFLIDQQNEGNAWNLALMQNAGKPASVFTSKGFLTVEQRNQVRQEILRRYSGKRNAGFPLVLEADMAWQQMSMSPYELDWLSSRELNTREIAAIFNVAPELAGDSAGKTFANQHEARQALYTENILPKLDRYRDHLNSWLVPMYADLVRSGAWFTYDKKDIETLASLYAEQEAAIAAKATGLWNDGLCDLYTAQAMQSLTPDKNGKGIYKMGEILVRSEDLQAYAQQALQKPAAPPSPVPEPLLNQPPSGGSSSPTAAPTPPVPGNGGASTDSTDDTSATDTGDGDTDTPSTAPAKRRARPAVAAKVLDLATDAHKQAYMAHVETLRADCERQAVEKVRTYFAGEQHAVVAALNGASDPIGAVKTTLANQDSTLQHVLLSILQDTAQVFFSDVTDQFEAARTKVGRRHGARKVSAVSIFSAAAMQYLLTMAASQVTQISATTLTQLQRLIADGVANGDSTAQIATAIEDAYSGYITPVRAQAIAATEVCAASNWAAMQAAGQSGLTLNKVWLATGDAHTRPDHAAADGQEVPMDEPFEVGGYQMQQPGDPTGPAKEVTNCRCTVFFRRAQAVDTSPDESGNDASADESGTDDATIDDTSTGSSKRRTYASVRDFMEAVTR